MKAKPTLSLLCLVFAIFLFCQSSFAQLYPVSFDQRVTNSSLIAIVQLKEQKSYWDDQHANIWTRNVFEVKSYLKGSSTATALVAISPGGIVGHQAQIVCPAEKYEPNTDYLLLLKDDNRIVDDKEYRSIHPEIVQCLSYAGVQSMLPYEDGIYQDELNNESMTEKQLLDRMDNTYGLRAKRPNGTIYTARNIIPNAHRAMSAITGITDGTGSLPATGFVNATIPSNNELIINGSGFGSTAGTVQFTNNSGPGFITSGAEDLISWSDTQIRIKIPDDAGTGTFRVRDNTATVIASSSITIKWGEINVTQSVYNFSSPQRQQVRLLDWNSLGGYTFEFSSNTTNGPAFSADAAAKSVFKRAVSTWRCNTLVNFSVAATSNTAGYASDGISAVLYDNVDLPAGALAVCVSRFNWDAATVVCEKFNTVWYLQEMDILVLSIPSPGLTWNFSTSAPTGSQVDFESVMLHEIGHGHGLSHINVPSTAMYFSISNGVAKRLPSANEIQAGQYRIAVSNSNCLNTNGFPDYTPHHAVSVGSCSIVLPVTLFDFSGQKRLNVIDLQWITSSENNVRGFYIEKSTNGHDFSTIGFVPSQGSSTDKHTYTFTDNNTSFQGVVYYRLRIEDMNNGYSYSKVVSFKTDGGVWKLFPNPAGDKTYLVADKTYNGALLLEILDFAGRKIQSQQLDQLNPGTAIPIQLKKLTSGVYFIKVSSAEKILMTDKLYKN